MYHDKKVSTTNHTARRSISLPSGHLYSSSVRLELVFGFSDAFFVTSEGMV